MPPGSNLSPFSSLVVERGHFLCDCEQLNIYISLVVMDQSIWISAFPSPPALTYSLYVMMFVSRVGILGWK